MVRIKNTCSSTEKFPVIIVGFIVFPLWFFGCFIMVNMIFIDPSNGTTWFFLVFPGIGGLSLMALSMLDLLSEYIFYEEKDCYVVEKIKFSSIKKIKFLKSNFVCFQYQVEEQEETANLFLKYRKNGKIFKVSVLHVWMKKEVKDKIIRELDWHVPFR